MQSRDRCKIKDVFTWSKGRFRINVNGSQINQKHDKQKNIGLKQADVKRTVVQQFTGA